MILRVALLLCWVAVTVGYLDAFHLLHVGGPSRKNIWWEEGSAGGRGASIRCFKKYIVNDVCSATLGRVLTLRIAYRSARPDLPHAP